MKCTPHAGRRAMDDSSERPTIRTMTSRHLGQIVRLHQDVFPGHFLTHLGERVLTRFYREFVDTAGDLATLSVLGDKVVGFVVGTSDVDLFYRRFYRRNGLALVPLLVGRFLVDAYVRRSVWSRLGHIRLALRSLLRSGGRRPAAGERSATGVPVRLLSIGVAHELRGTEVAAEMMQHFCRQLQDLGKEEVGLSVYADNGCAIRFYEKTGWERRGSSGKSISFVRSLRPSDACGGEP